MKLILIIMISFTSLSILAKEGILWTCSEKSKNPFYQITVSKGEFRTMRLSIIDSKLNSTLEIVEGTANLNFGDTYFYSNQTIHISSNEHTFRSLELNTNEQDFELDQGNTGRLYLKNLDCQKH
ncbi:hypothetical protein N9O57_00135 [bacterium]|nr:hypothetical protein [bacterium]